MKQIIAALFVVLSTSVSGYATNPGSVKQNFKKGSPDIKTVNALAFGPEGILFIGDSKNASLFAIDTGDETVSESGGKISIQKFDEKIAASLGTTVDNISIADMAVNPHSKKLYFAVHHNDGTPLILKLEGEKFVALNLKDIKYDVISIKNAVAEDAKDRRGRPLRTWAIADLQYSNGNVMLSGLSNMEFGSTFRSISFPFTNGGEQTQSSLEIYHAAHAAYETHAPIKTFTTVSLNGADHLVASYTCTPLVLFPLKELVPGKHVKGRTVAELGAGNSPLDMIRMDKEGKSYLLMSNSNRGIMKIGISALEAYKDSLTEPVTEKAGTEGIHFVTLPYVNVVQMDKLDNDQFVVLQRKSNGDLNLSSVGNWWL